MLECDDERDGWYLSTVYAIDIDIVISRLTWHMHTVITITTPIVHYLWSMEYLSVMEDAKKIYIKKKCNFLLTIRCPSVVGWLVGLPVCHNFLKEWEITLAFTPWSTFVFCSYIHMQGM